MATISINGRDRYGPASMLTLVAKGFSVAAIRFGDSPVAVVSSPCDQATDDLVSSDTSVWRIPDNLDASAITADFKTFLEQHQVPADWMADGLSWREIVRGILGIFLFAQRYEGEGGSLPVLDVSVDSLPQSVRDAFQRAAVSLEYDTTLLTGTVRQMLRAMGQQWGDKPIYLGDVTL